MRSDTHQSFTKTGQAAVEIFDSQVHGFDFLVGAVPDHVCFKCRDREEFEQIRNWYEDHGHWIYQTEISGRAIATIKLRDPFDSALGPIEYLELSDQKPDNSQKSGWDHIEVLTPGGDYDGCVRAAHAHSLNVVEKIRPHHTTHEIRLDNEFKLVFTKERLVEKIREEI